MTSIVGWISVEDAVARHASALLCLDHPSRIQVQPYVAALAASVTKGNLDPTRLPVFADGTVCLPGGLGSEMVAAWIKSDPDYKPGKSYTDAVAAEYKAELENRNRLPIQEWMMLAALEDSD